MAKTCEQIMESAAVWYIFPSLYGVLMWSQSLFSVTDGWEQPGACSPIDSRAVTLELMDPWGLRMPIDVST